MRDILRCIKEWEENETSCPISSQGDNVVPSSTPVVADSLSGNRQILALDGLRSALLQALNSRDVVLHQGMGSCEKCQII
jgi:hypothetical protein